LAKTADIGNKPPERAFPKRTISGFTPSHSEHNNFPVLPIPV